MSSAVTILDSLRPAHRRAFLDHARKVSFPQSWRICAEGRFADRFWVIESGAVSIDMEVPGRGEVSVETLGPGELIGWSWLFPPYRWQVGAHALGSVGAYEFNAAEVRDLCKENPVLGQAIVLAAAQTIAQRLSAARARMLDLYGPRLQEHS
ncbi:cyclic nucleotide-binding domain-containing protein [Streptomyces sp. ME01-24h]|nr:cyclic nucleotide-binding domain-containing protein [Streptomyces sp. ME19-03-3]MDX3357220.1 cyclic nucleotide-binding domain-containing protein [Streptomyces sp. ME01-24h]